MEHIFRMERRKTIFNIKASQNISFFIINKIGGNINVDKMKIQCAVLKKKMLFTLIG